MKYYNREDKLVDKRDVLDEFLEKVYGVDLGRKLIKQLCNRNLSRVVGDIMNSSKSKKIVDRFIEFSNIDMSLYEDKEYESYNDFFIRKTAKGVREFSNRDEDFCAPCDAKLSVYTIGDDTKVKIKNSTYSMEKLFKSEKIADYFSGGLMLIFRLSVDNYHRYSYFDDAKKSRNYRIRGKFYSVSPAVLDKVDVFKENEREYTLLNTKNFGKVLQMEVGATLVGKIVNHHGEKFVKRGEEKGYFEFGGSTIVLVFEKNRLKLEDKYIFSDYEREVRMGDILGERVN